MRQFIVASPHRSLLIQYGFTLIELMIVLALVSILTAGILGFFNYQRRTYLWEEQKLERDQHIRTALNSIIRELRLAGFCAADDAFVEQMSCWVPKRFIPTYPLQVTFDGNPKVTFGDGAQPDMITFACVLPTELNPTTVRKAMGGTKLVTALGKSKTKEQYRIGDVLQVGYLPEYAIVRGMNGRELTVDTDPIESGCQPLSKAYPAGTFIGEIYTVSYAVFNETNDPEFKRHTAGRPELKRKVNAGGFQPVVDFIDDMKISTNGPGRIQVTLTATTDRPLHGQDDMDGVIEVTGDVLIRNVMNTSLAIACN